MDKEDNAGFDEVNDSFEVDRESRELVFGAGKAYRCLRPSATRIVIRRYWARYRLKLLGSISPSLSASLTYGVTTGAHRRSALMSSRQKTSGGGLVEKNWEVVLACVVFLVVYPDPRAPGYRDRFQGWSLVHAQPLHYPTKTLVLHHQLSPSTSPHASPGECAYMCTCVRWGSVKRCLVMYKRLTCYFFRSPSFRPCCTIYLGIALRLLKTRWYPSLDRNPTHVLHQLQNVTAIVHRCPLTNRRRSTRFISMHKTTQPLLRTCPQPFSTSSEDMESPMRLLVLRAINSWKIISVSPYLPLSCGL
jgi:hypothetical protein